MGANITTTPMPIVNTIRTERRTIEGRRRVDAKPKYKNGDYLEVYSGYLEGHEFYVKAVRFNEDTQQYEYLYDWPMGANWYSEGQLTKNHYA